MPGHGIRAITILYNPLSIFSFPSHPFLFSFLTLLLFPSKLCVVISVSFSNQSCFQNFSWYFSSDVPLTFPYCFTRTLSVSSARSSSSSLSLIFYFSLWAFLFCLSYILWYVYYLAIHINSFFIPFWISWLILQLFVKLVPR